MKRAAEYAILAAILSLAAWLRAVPPSAVADLAIVPDSGQYAVAAHNLAHGRGLWIHINDLRLPLMYPPGFPLILAAFYRLTGAPLHDAVRVVGAFGVAAVLLTYLFARGVFGAATAALAALLLAVAPSSVGYSRVLISDMASNTFLVAGLWLAWRGTSGDGARPLLWLSAGLCCGLSASIHLLSGMSVVPLAVAAGLAARGNPRGTLARLVPAAAGLAAGLTPVLAYNHAAFGSMFENGYEYWALRGRGKPNFSLRYAFANTAVPEGGTVAGNIGYYLRHLFGLSWPTLFAPYFPSVLVLAALGAAACLGDDRDGAFAFAAMAVSFILSVVCALFTYSFQMAKFLLPVVPFACILAARGAAALAGRCRGAGVRPLLWRIPAAAILAVTAWGCVEPLRRARAEGEASIGWHEGLRLLDRLAPVDACLVSGIDGVIVTHYFVGETGRLYIPVSAEAEYVRHRPLPVRTAAEDPAFLEELMAAGRKVYMDGFTYRWWGAPRRALEREFVFRPAASYHGGAMTIYELLPGGA
ncbi:MAG: glycosyltransferase family 39 protein [bacterium]|nr:glycosyltransferase family 39 protein [bacterium]